MNRDKKIAFFLTPFLLVGGYVISDIYMENKANETKLFSLSIADECSIFDGDCILESGDMQINITDLNGITKANTSYPVDSVAISLVYDNGKEVIYGLDQAGSPQYWERETDIRNAMTKAKTASKLRIVTKYKGSTYLSEFGPTPSDTK